MKRCSFDGDEPTEGSTPQMQRLIIVCIAPMRLYACLTISGCAPNEKLDDVLGYLLPDLDQGITKLLERLNDFTAADI